MDYNAMLNPEEFNLTQEPSTAPVGTDKKAHRRLRRKVVEPEDARPIAKTTALASEKNRAEQNEPQVRSRGQG
jgi:hypothetical protein